MGQDGAQSAGEWRAAVVKRTALKRRVSLRDSFRKKLKLEGTRVHWQRNGQLKRTRPLKKVSRSQRSRLAVYFVLAAEFLLKPENRLCIICQVRREHGENILIQIATEVHHWAGRIGRLLCYVPFFRASCRGCRDWPHAHPAKAREWGLLAPASLWNVYPQGATISNRSSD